MTNRFLILNCLLFFIMLFSAQSGTNTQASQNLQSFSKSAPNRQSTGDFLVFIGDYVWGDLNSNGIQDAGEGGIPNVVVKLYDANTNQAIAQATTDENGTFFFIYSTLVYCQQCFLEVDRNILLEEGYAITKQYQTASLATSANDSDFSQITGRTPVFSLAILGVYNEFDLGLIRIPNCPLKYDIALALDLSESLGNLAQSDIRYLTNFAQVITRGFTIGPSITQIGVVGFAAANDYKKGVYNSQIEIDLNDYPNNQLSLINAIGNITRTIDRKYNATSLWEGLHLSHNALLQGRPNIPNIIIMVSDLNDNEAYGNGNPIDKANTIKTHPTQPASIFIVKLALSPQTTEEARKITNYTNGIPTTNTLPYVIGGNLANSTDLINVAITTITAVCSGGANAPLRNYFTTTTPTLSWVRVTDAVQYHIQVDTDARFTLPLDFEATIPASQLEITTTPLADATYHWRVHAIKAGGSGGWSTVDTFVVDANP